MAERKFKVIASGFDGSRLRHPGDGKGPVVLNLAKNKKCPSWLEEMKPETAAEKKKRVASEKQASEAAAKIAEQDQEAKDEMSFLDGENSNDSVETL